MPYSKRHNLIYFHVPKTGGTTINNLLGIKGMMPNSLYMDTNPALQHMTPDMVYNFVGDKVWFSTKKVISIREPIERAVSDFLWFKRAGKLHDMDEYLDTMSKLRKSREYWLHSDGCHFIPLSDYTFGEEGQLEADIIFYDTFERDVKRVFPWVTEVPHLNKNKDTYELSEVEIARLTNLLIEDIEEYNNLKELYGDD